MNQYEKDIEHYKGAHRGSKQFYCPDLFAAGAAYARKEMAKEIAHQLRGCLKGRNVRKRILTFIETQLLPELESE